MGLDLATAERIVKGAIASAEKEGIKLSIAVVDEAGNLIQLSRMDGAFFISPQIAMGKAFAAAAWQTSSADLEKRAQTAPAFYSGISTMTGGRAIVRQGALPVVINGQFVGAVGASGGTLSTG